MKKLYLLLSIFLLTQIVNALNINIPDANFKGILLANSNINTDGNNEISYGEAVSFTGTINVKSMLISDLTGIESFENLGSLMCDGNQLTSLNVSANKALAFLSCSSNQLTDLDVSQNTALSTLVCYSNELTGLDLSANTALSTLFCYTNHLTYLNVNNGNNHNCSLFNATGNPNLSCIQVDDVAWSNEHWTDIDASASFNEDCFSTTYVPDDNFEQALIDLGYDDVLDDYVLTANINKLTDLDISDKGIGDLTGIEDFTALITLDCAYNYSLTNLDLSQNIALEVLKCYKCSLVRIDVSQNTVLTQLYCQDNELTSLNVKNGNNNNFTGFHSERNGNLTCIQVDDAAWSTSNWTDIDDASFFVNSQAECNALSLDEFDINHFQIFPNPVNDFVIVAIEVQASYQLTTIYGQELQKGTLKKGENTLNISSLPNGAYLLQVKSAKGISAKKLVKE